MASRLQRVPKHQGMGYVDVENGATRGAIVGVNLVDTSGNIIPLEDILNTDAPPAEGVDQGAIDAAIAAHVAETDPHSQYLTEAEADGLYDELGAASDSMAAHLLDPDPHPQYLEDAQATALGLTLLGAADAPAARVATDTFTTTIGPAPPASGNASGDRWIDDVDGTEYVYYDDGSSQQWVQFGVSVSGNSTSVLGVAVVSGVAATQFSLPAVDLSAFREFKVLIRLKNATASNATVSLLFNGDAVAANYSRQLLTAIGVAITGGSAANAIIGTMLASETLTGELTILSDFDGKARVFGHLVGSAASTVNLGHFSSARNVVANVTDLMLQSSVAGSFAVGSTFTLIGVR